MSNNPKEAGSSKPDSTIIGYIPYTNYRLELQCKFVDLNEVDLLLVQLPATNKSVN